MCVAIKSNTVLEAQEKCLSHLCDTSRKRKLRFYITNNMMDETKLPLGKPICRKRRCLAWHGQATWSSDINHVVDVDVARAPRILGRYTAATLYNLMAKSSDTTGLHPRGDALPDAHYHASLTATDTHSVNVLLSKVVSVDLPPKHFHIGSMCMQHRTGSVCEEVSKRWELLPPTFCLTTQLMHGDFHDDLKEAVRSTLTKYLHVHDDGEPVGLDEAAERAHEFAKEILNQCYVGRTSDNQGEEEVDMAAAEARRRVEAERFLQFFRPPWQGVLQHPCPVGCCGPTPCHDRKVSIDRGTDLIMTIIIPHITRPAANRYTKVFPVAKQVCLMLHFNSVFKKSARKLLQGRTDNSDDEDVLHDANALVGALVDAIAHQRQLQADGGAQS
jgi:hypothetical protein